MSPLYLYEGAAFDETKLLHVRGPFGRAFFRSLEKFRGNTLVVTCDAEGRYIRRSFGEFGEDVAKARSYIRARSGGAGVAATLADNNYVHLVFIVAILLEGLTLCPLTPEDPPARLRQKLESLAERATVFGEPRLLSSLHREIPSFPMEDYSAFSAAPVSSTPPSVANPAILIFTSGSTGYSKIVEQLEQNILANVDALIERHRLGPGESIATSMPIHHVNALEFAFFCCLFSGAKLVLLKKFQIDGILQAIARESVTIVSLFPQLVSQLLLRKNRVLASNLHSLRYVVSAAAPLSPRIADEFDRAFPFRLVQGYGLSEAVNFSTLMPTGLPREEHRFWLTGHDRPSIGTALRGNQLFVLDADGRELGEREVGELAVRGHNVTRGYRGDSERRLFRGDYLHTGDLGYYVSSPANEKFFFITGRAKDVAKRFGKTISLVEIDDILMSLLPAKAIAVPFAHDISGEEIAIVIQSDRPHFMEPSAIKALFIERMPEEEHPKVVLLTCHPVRTASGKACRWQFAPRFKDFQGKIFGPGILLLDER